MNRRTVDSRGSTVDTDNARASICVDQPVSIASHTASSGCKCRTLDGTSASADTSRDPPSATPHPREVDGGIVHLMQAARQQP